MLRALYIKFLQRVPDVYTFGRHLSLSNTFLHLHLSSRLGSCLPQTATCWFRFPFDHVPKSFLPEYPFQSPHPCWIIANAYKLLTFCNRGLQMAKK
ncbi:hypothetical protein R1flu_016904 [Riccia fluitans]|uniref:Uncharacterized protein n=1 Tax=Riccia fluitans TaxID=41844 RepID=A0ABD1YNF7_9MARC